MRWAQGEERRLNTALSAAAGVVTAAVQHALCHVLKPLCVHTLSTCVQDKLQAIIDRAAFMPCFLTGASLEVSPDEGLLLL